MKPRSIERKNIINKLNTNVNIVKIVESALFEEPHRFEHSACWVQGEPILQTDQAKQSILIELFNAAHALGLNPNLRDLRKVFIYQKNQITSSLCSSN
jgi:hypothetical protein